MPIESRFLLDALSRELAAGREFESLLETERGELLGGRPECLPELAARKAELARRVADLSKARGEALVSAGLSPGRIGLERVHAAAGIEARRVLNDLGACARRIRELRHENELFVNLRLQQVNAALAVLRQQEPDSPEVYSPDGRAHAGTTRHTRARA
jgi:flagellar biosynthesis/type III secretory pathway chaperone